MAQKINEAGVMEGACNQTPGGPQDALGEHHPLAKLAGGYKDDPFWDECVQAMRDAREAEDCHPAGE